MARRVERDPYGLVPCETLVDGRPVRALTAGRSGALPELVLLPGLGAPGYLAPLARACSEWTAVAVLDLPGWRYGRARSCAPTLDAVAATTARWLEETGRADVVLFGHSTGAQAVPRAIPLARTRVSGGVLAGPTFDPDVRTVPALVRRGVPTLARESPGELPAVLPSYLHSGGRPLLRFLHAALRDRPEDLVVGLHPDLLVVTGARDGLAPPAWASHLAALASARVAVLPGAHNFCFPDPARTSALLRDTLTAWRR